MSTKAKEAAANSIEAVNEKIGKLTANKLSLESKVQEAIEKRNELRQARQSASVNGGDVNQITKQIKALDESLDELSDAIFGHETAIREAGAVLDDLIEAQKRAGIEQAADELRDIVAQYNVVASQMADVLQAMQNVQQRIPADELGNIIVLKDLTGNPVNHRLEIIPKLFLTGEIDAAALQAGGPETYYRNTRAAA